MIGDGYWLLAIPARGRASCGKQRAIQNAPQAFLAILVLAFMFAAPFGINAADGFATNRLTLSGRVGFGFSAHFSGISVAPVPANRTTPNGDAYNYDNGYVLTDATGNFGGQTWYWGYDNSASQVSGNNILLSRTSGVIGSSKADDGPGLGAELVYTRMLGGGASLHYGFEVAVNYLNFSVNDNGPLAASLSRQTDAFPFTPGATPPDATPSNPYQGSFQGPGFLIGDAPVSSSTAVVPGVGVSNGHRDFDADLWGVRIGPCLEFPLNKKLTLGVSGGFAAALVNADASWSESIVISGLAGPTLSGSGHNSDVVFGAYIAANAAWEFNERWSIVCSAQYQYLSSYEHSFGGRTIEADLHGFFVALGIGYKF